MFNIKPTDRPKPVDPMTKAMNILAMVQERNPKNVIVIFETEDGSVTAQFSEMTRRELYYNLKVGEVIIDRLHFPPTLQQRNEGVSNEQTQHTKPTSTAE